MSLSLEYVVDPPRARIVAEPDILPGVWHRIVDLAIAVQPACDIVGQRIDLDWPSFLNMAPQLAELRAASRFEIRYNDGAREQLRRYREEFRAIRAAALVQPRIPEDQVQERVDDYGFVRTLTPAQRRDISRMATLRNAANFSVPGAGKTTVALAVHLLVRDDSTNLLVVAPKNAFGAWDDVLTECLDPFNTTADHTPFVRLEGGSDSIRRLLAQLPRRAIISYDQLIRTADEIVEYLRTHRVHLVLDESHRMKAGERSQRGSTLLNIAHLASRRDILTGTPIPRSIDDIAPQLDFLWPGQGLGYRVATAANPSETLRSLYVRTTKHELGLPPITRHFVPVEMSRGQLALYSLLRDQLVSRLAGIRMDANIDLVTARRSVIRLLQVASSPVLTVRRLTNENVEGFPYNDEQIESVFRDIMASGDSPKLVRAAQIARDILARGPDERVVIWTSFTENVERLADMLSDQGATFIHGGVRIGSETDPGTREGRLRAFHDPGGHCRVLVANPAACSEGISLHRVCHNAIYVDRTYNAAHYLQSVDRIHRLGLPPDTETHVYVLESIAPGALGSIDYSVRRRMITKLNTMAQALDDPDLQRLALNEDEGDQPLNFDITVQDIADLIDEMTGRAELPGEESI
jgi:SNF2 family DNA or RNA helicase